MRKWYNWKRRAAALLCTLCCLLGGCGGNRLEKGLKALERGEYNAAVRALNESIERGENLAEAYAARGDAHLALSEGASRSIRDTERQAALSDYEAALERNRNDTHTKGKLLNLYLLLGDEAVEAAESGVNPAASYETARGYFEAALPLNYANAAVYERLAAVLLSQNQTEQAAAVLEKGAAATHSVTLTTELEEVRETLNRKAEEARLAVAEQSLQGIPYYGDSARCNMTPEQALGYAQLLADGLTGKFQGFSGYGRPLFDGNVFWDEPYAVVGYGSYETNRAWAILGDFAGDGNPYLYVFSSLVNKNSFEIYGWRDGQVKLAAGVEAYGGQQEGVLTDTSPGTLLLELSEATGERSWSGQVFRFAEGGTTVSRVWDATWDPTRNAMRVTTNGVPEMMSETAWNRLRTSSPSAELDRTAADALALREMIARLNAYAAALGGTDAVPVPEEHTDRHNMATAMLRKLFALDQQSVSAAGARLSDTRLMDLNGDGQEELVAAFQGNYQTESEITCQFALYHWRNGELLEIPGGYGFQELHLVRYGGETGVLGAGRIPEDVLTVSDGQAAIERGQTITTLYAYTFLSHAEAVREEERPDGNRYYVIKGGAPVPIAESEFNAIRAKYDEIEPMVNYRSEAQNSSYGNIVSALYRIRTENP